MKTDDHTLAGSLGFDNEAEHIFSLEKRVELLQRQLKELIDDDDEQPRLDRGAQALQLAEKGKANVFKTAKYGTLVLLIGIPLALAILDRLEGARRGRLGEAGAETAYRRAVNLFALGDTATAVTELA